MRAADPGKAGMPLTALMKAFLFRPVFFEDAGTMGANQHTRLWYDCLAMFLTYHRVRSSRA